MSEVYSGRCLCGAIKFEARGKPKGIFWCHCDSCRRHTGAPCKVQAEDLLLSGQQGGAGPLAAAR